MLSAISSLPVPLSPVIKTVESVGAALIICVKILRMAAPGPIISGKSSRASTLPRILATLSNT